MIFDIDPAHLCHHECLLTPVVASLRSRTIVPGQYLFYLREEVGKSLNRGDTLQDAVDKIDQSRFKHLANFDQLARRNANQVFLEMEKEAF
jgi:hypothetical protein